MKNQFIQTLGGLLVFVFSLLQITVLAQNEQQKVVNPIPPEPTAAALGRYGEVPVSLYSGIPQISIPIFDARGRRLSVPISLSYHAGGNRVEDIASWVGLGWSLNAGGVINRTVRGIPDKESNNGFYSVGLEASTLVPPTDTTDANYNFDNDRVKQFATGVLDTEPDVFMFNFGGQSGRFVIDYDKTVKTIIPHNKLRIEPTFGVLNEITSFVVTGEDGTEYHFSDIIETFAVPACRQISDVHPIYSYNSSWYLTTIVAANDLDSINFFYSSPYTITTDHVTTSSSPEYFWGGPTGDSFCNGETTYNALRLERIESALFNVELIATTDREDLPHNSLPADKQLDRIEVKDKSNNLVKAFNLNYSYFRDSPTADVYNKRLRLDQVQEEGKNGALNPSYVLEYNSTVEIPSLSSQSQDLWGFYNGKPNTTLIPELTIKGTTLGEFIGTQFFQTQTRTFEGADRSCDVDKSQFAILTKITYPTGGFSIFDYESNDYDRNKGRLFPPPQESFDVLRDASDHRVFSNPTTVSASAFYSGQQNDVDTFDISFSQTVSVSSVVSGPFYGPGELSGEIREVTLERIDVTPVEVKLTYDNEDCGNCPASYLDEITLETGTYRVTATATLDDGGDFNSISLQYFNDVEDPPVLSSGGLRIQRVTSQTEIADAAPIVKRYKYTDDNTSTLSSGILRKPVRHWHVIYPYSNVAPQITRSSHANSGRNYEPIYYSHVIVLEGENGENGRTEYKFESPLLDADVIAPDFYPFPQATSYNWIEGLNKSTKVYTAAGSILSDVTNSYSHQLMDEVRGYKFAYHQNFWVLPAENALYDKFSSSLSTGYSQLIQSIEKRYDQHDPSKLITVTTDFQYENPDHLQLTRQTVHLENGSKQITHTLYPHDAPNIAGTLDLIAQNSINLPIESQTWIEESGGTKLLTGGVRTEYLGDVLADEVLQMQIASPVNFTETEPTVVLANSLFERRINYPKYDPHGNIRELFKEDDVVTSFIWGYDQTMPVAQIVNADYDAAVATLPSGDLTLLQGSTLTEQQIRDKIDIIRQALPDAQVTCYTYNPQVGMTSTTDPRGITTDYFYDDLNRLRHIEDHNGNVVQKFEYQYSNDGTQ